MSSAHEVQEKLQFVADLLKKDPLMAPQKIIDAVKKQFESGISRAEVAKVRMDNYGIKLGPGGVPLNKEGKRLQPEAKEVEVVGGSLHRNRLDELVGELQREMRVQQVNTITIPDQGPAQALQLVKRTIQA